MRYIDIDIHKDIATYSLKQIENANKRKILLKNIIPKSIFIKYIYNFTLNLSQTYLYYINHNKIQKYTNH